MFEEFAKAFNAIVGQLNERNAKLNRVNGHQRGRGRKTLDTLHKGVVITPETFVDTSPPSTRQQLRRFNMIQQKLVERRMKYQARQDRHNAKRAPSAAATPTKAQIASASGQEVVT